MTVKRQKKRRMKHLLKKSLEKLKDKTTDLNIYRCDTLNLRTQKSIFHIFFPSLFLYLAVATSQFHKHTPVSVP